MDFYITKDRKVQLPDSDQPTTTIEASTSEVPTSEAPTSETPNYVILEKDVPVMVIKVKASIAVDHDQLNPHDCIELLIYCQYIMRLKKVGNFNRWPNLAYHEVAKNNIQLVSCQRLQGII